MGTATQTALVVAIPVEILGPKSEYERRRLALKYDVIRNIAEAKKIIVVDSPESKETANNIGRVLQAADRERETFFKPVKSAIDAFKAPVLAAENELKASLDSEKKRLGSLITVYDAEVKRKKDEQDRIAREEAEAKAKKDAEDARLADAAILEAAGDEEGAEQLLNEPVHYDVGPIVTQVEAPAKMVGQVSTQRWKVTITDAKEVYRAIADGKLPMEAAPIDEGWLKRKANLDKNGFSVPGCTAEPETTTHFRA